ncbi:pentapeptide repeat-containing protein [Aeromicrobium sp. 179-A 4D2 NHS]|uniref:pentapeptide repeat-containing protein n=1 Tax=Aeromicrobium sp. 179-A 4D2 NHS TaxID=3142375 RepID=UPI0039A37484
MDEDWREIDESTYDYRDLRRGDLGAADFSGQSMRGVLLMGRRFAGLNVRGSNLTGAHLDGGMFTDADFRETDLTRASSEASMFNDCDFRAAVMDETRLEARWRDTDLSLLVAKNSTLHGSFMTVVNAQSASFTDVGMKGSNFHRVNFDKAVFKSDVDRTSLTNTEMFATTFRYASISGTDMDKVKVREGDFTGASIFNSNLNWAELTSTDFTGVHVSDVTLRGAKFTRCVFAGALIEGQLDEKTRFDDCDLSGARFVLADNPDNRAAAPQVEAAGAVIDWT